MKASKGDWVNVYNIIFKPEERAPQVPEDTKKVPLETWVKGFIQDAGTIGEIVTIKTITGREVKGKLVEINPSHGHSFGQMVPEVLQIGLRLKAILFGGEAHE